MTGGLSRSKTLPFCALKRLKHVLAGRTGKTLRKGRLFRSYTVPDVHSITAFLLPGQTGLGTTVLLTIDAPMAEEGLRVG